MKMKDTYEDDAEKENENEEDDDCFHVQLATPSTEPSRNNLGEKVRKSALTQQ